MQLAQSLVLTLNETSVKLLYRAIKPLIRNDQHGTGVQKRAYKVLLGLCENHAAIICDDGNLKELIDLMVDSLMTCHVSARNMRLKCLTHVVSCFSSDNKQQQDNIPNIIGEVMLCLKDSNGKTR